MSNIIIPLRFKNASVDALCEAIPGDTEGGNNAIDTLH
jgi:hypothetical protein